MTDPDDFSRRFLGEVLPLLQEYAYEDYRLLKDLIGDALVDVEAQTLRTLVLRDPGALVEALAQSFQETASDNGARAVDLEEWSSRDVPGYRPPSSSTRRS